MFNPNGRIYGVLNWIYKLAYVNVLFILGCIPVISCFASLMALFGVTRQWMSGNEPPVFETFFRLLKTNFKRSFAVGGLILAITLFLWADYAAVLNSQHLKWMISILTVVSFCFVMTTLYAFVLLTDNSLLLSRVVVSAFKIGAYRVDLTLLNLAILAALTMTALMQSFLIVSFYFSGSAVITCWITTRKYTAFARSNGFLELTPME